MLARRKSVGNQGVLCRPQRKNSSTVALCLNSTNILLATGVAKAGNVNDQHAAARLLVFALTPVNIPVFGFFQFRFWPLAGPDANVLLQLTRHGHSTGSIQVLK